MSLSVRVALDSVFYQASVHLDQDLSVTANQDNIVADSLSRQMWWLSGRFVKFGLLLNFILGYQILKQRLGLVLNVLALIMHSLPAVGWFNFGY